MGSAQIQRKVVFPVMGNSISERTLKMEESYVNLLNKGHSPSEIADQFNLSVSTVYKRLDAIAERAGVHRSVLLKVARSPHSTHERQFDPVKPVDLTNWRQNTEQTLTDINQVIRSTAQSIQTAETNQQQFEEEEKSWK